MAQFKFLSGLGDTYDKDVRAHVLRGFHKSKKQVVIRHARKGSGHVAGSADKPALDRASDHEAHEHTRSRLPLDGHPMIRVVHRRARTSSSDFDDGLNIGDDWANSGNAVKLTQPNHDLLGSPAAWSVFDTVVGTVSMRERFLIHHCKIPHSTLLATC